jgi:hypothetical protein
MRAIDIPAICQNGGFTAQCKCGKVVLFSSKSSAAAMLARGSCRHCKRDYRSVKGDVGIVRLDGGWGKHCSGCGVMQKYTRKDHAKQSMLGDWQCKKCVAKARGFSANQPVGAERRAFSRYFKSAKNRGIPWLLDLDSFVAKFSGTCSLSGWPISMSDRTASLDRIDSSMGYTEENVQWVHTMVNMSKNKYKQVDFINMCISVAQAHKAHA